MLAVVPHCRLGYFLDVRLVVKIVSFGHHIGWSRMVVHLCLKMLGLILWSTVVPF